MCGKRDHHHLPTMPPLTCASTGDQSAVSGPPPSVCTCVFARVTQGQQISGRVCWQTGKVLTQINTLSQAREHALTTSTQTLRSFAMWVFVWVFCVCARQQMVLSFLPVAMGDNRLIRKMSQTVNDEI